MMGINDCKYWYWLTSMQVLLRYDTEPRHIGGVGQEAKKFFWTYSFDLSQIYSRK